MVDKRSSDGRQTGGRFASGNNIGRGRSEGSRNKASLAVDALLDGEAEALTRKAIDLALDGDTVALRLCLERLCPPRRDRSVRIKMARMETPQDVLGAIATVVGAVARGAITPSEGQALASLRNTPAELCPDWVLISHIVGRAVGPKEAAEIYEDEGFWAMMGTC